MSENVGGNELKVLQVLLYGEVYGLEIIEKLKTKQDVKISLGGLYATLHRLEKKKYIKGRFGESTAETGGNRRKYYKPTVKGQDVALQAREDLSLLWEWGVPGA